MKLNLPRLTHPCDECENKKFCDEFDVSRKHLECLRYSDYQARLDERARVAWAIVDWLVANTYDFGMIEKIHQTLKAEGIGSGGE